MKQIVSMICVSWLCVSAMAQSVTYATLNVATNKTTALIFPSPVKRGDIGTKDILAQQVKENENILFVKAARAQFPETNLNVVTADGKLYTFTVVYDSAPRRTVYNISSKEAVNTNEVLFTSEPMNPSVVEATAKSLLTAKRTMYGIRDSRWDILARINGIYIKENVLFFQLVLNNLSTVNYNIDYIRFFITDNKIPKRTAAQELELKPLCRVGSDTQIKANGKATIVFAFEKFTIPEAKSFLVQINEKNGGRQLQLKVKNDKLLNASLVN